MKSAEVMACETQYISDLTENGIVEFAEVLDEAGCESLYQKVKRVRDFGPSLFLSEEDFDADPQYKGTNPRPGRNLLHTFDNDLDFFEKSPVIVDFLTEALGPDYYILDKKFVCGIPEKWIPEWLLRRIRGVAVNNLGPYIRPEYRDITYFYGIDYHQDIIDWKSRPADFLTVYVYIHEVGLQDAPLHVLPGTHKLGATLFPHNLERNDNGIWRYRSQNDEMTSLEKKLVGKAGYVGAWHACTLHGTQPDVADSERISLRYLIARDPKAARVGIDEVNETLRGRLSLEETRFDLAEDGSAAIKQNVINAV